MSALTRKLAAILAADVAGYSRLMGADESATLAALRELRQDLAGVVGEHRGEVVKSMGDGWLVEFGSVVDAVNCALTVQEKLAGHAVIKLRIGIHIGDIVHEDEDIYGDGVNIAARLQEIAEPGGIALSDNARRSLDAKLAGQFRDAGEQELKNIAEAVRVFVSGGVEKEVADAPLPLPDKPSIAVLPFDNMSGDPEQEYFADGITEDIITALSRFSSLFVIARNSSFTYKGRSVDITDVARDLGVQYVVEGSVRKAGNRVRITAQLIDAPSGKHVWADRFDGHLDEVFELQDQITEQIVVAVEPEISARERERVRRNPPEKLDAWALVQHGLSHFYRFTRADHDTALGKFQGAAELDPNFALAHAYVAYALVTSTAIGFVEDRTAALALAGVSAKKAISLDPNEPVAHYAQGRLNLHAREIEMAIGEMKTAIAINPNFARGHYGIGWVYACGAAQWEQALTHLENALRLSPRDPMRWQPLMLMGTTLRFLERYDEALAVGRQACQFPETSYQPLTNLASTLAAAEQINEAQAAFKNAMQLEPRLSMSFIREIYSGSHETYLTGYLDGLRKAGMAEE